MQGTRRGTSLATAILLGALAVTLGFTVAGVSFSHLSVSARLSNVQHARNLAEAAVAQAIERVVSNQGEYFKSAPLDLSVTLPGTPGGIGVLTFDPAQAASLDIPVSTYNMESDQSKLGHGGRVVPKRSIHFVGTGTCNGVVRRVEAILHVPVYKWALSSEGQLSSDGELIVAGAEHRDDVLPSVQARLDELLPGHIASNYTEGPPSLDLTATTQVFVKGDARAAGPVNLGANATVEGEVKANAGETDLPAIDLADFDPNLFGAPQGLPDPLPPDLMLGKGGLFRYNGDVVVNELRMPHDGTGVLLWVDGDLVVNGGMNGVGAVFATGNITIRGAGQTNVVADNVCAVVAGGDLTVEGTDRNGSFFQGVVATGGNATFRDVTVLGTVAVGASELDGVPLGPADPLLVLEDANVVHVPENIDFHFDAELMSQPGGGGGSHFGWAAPNVPPGHPTMGLNAEPRDTFHISHLYNPATDDFETDWSQWDGFTAYAYDEDSHTSTGSPFGYFQKDIEPATPGLQPGYLPSRAALKGVLHSIAANAGPITNGKDPSDPGYREYPDWAAFLAGEPDFNTLDDVIDRMNQVFIYGPDLGPGPYDPGTKYAESGLALVNEWYDEHVDQPQEQGAFSLDPNRFIGWDSRTRVVLWREL